MSPADRDQWSPIGSGFGHGLQHERTALAWERTAIAMMVAGIALARYAATHGHVLLGSVGIVQTGAGASLLLWAGRHSDMLHNPARPAEAVPQTTVARLVGLATIGFVGVALGLATIISLVGLP